MSDADDHQDDDKDPTPEGMRHDVKKIVTWLIIFGVVAGLAMALLIMKLTGTF